jgi:hypothetical protein
LITGPAKSAIKFEEVKFNGGPSFHENKTLYIPNPDPIRYVGTPSAEIDKAWEDLTDGKSENILRRTMADGLTLARYILITEEEARDTWGEEYVEFWDPYRGGYEVGLDVFHTLHCLVSPFFLYRVTFLIIPPEQYAKDVLPRYLPLS